MTKEDYENFKRIIEHLKKHKSKKYRLVKINPRFWKDDFSIDFEFVRKGK